MLSLQPMHFPTLIQQRGVGKGREKGPRAPLAWGTERWLPPWAGNAALTAQPAQHQPCEHSQGAEGNPCIPVKGKDGAFSFAEERSQPDLGRTSTWQQGANYIKHMQAAAGPWRRAAAS